MGFGGEIGPLSILYKSQYKTLILRIILIKMFEKQEKKLFDKRKSFSFAPNNDSHFATSLQVYRRTFVVL